MKTSDEMIKFIKDINPTPPRNFVIDLQNSKDSYLATDRGLLLDMACFHGTRLIGYNHPKMHRPEVQNELLIAATTKTANPDFASSYLYRYYDMLNEHAPRCMSRHKDMKIFVVNSGAEAVENALKHCIIKTGRNYFVSLVNGFHGRTMGALSVTNTLHSPQTYEKFRNYTSLTHHIHANMKDEDCMAELEKTVKLRGLPAGLIIELLQGAGGNVPLEPFFVRTLSKFCEKNDVPFIIDEVQTAGGQAGEFWMSDMHNYDCEPECIISGKRLGCGVLYMKDASSTGYLDTTWGGNLVDMVRVYHETKILFEENLIAKSHETALLFRIKLEELQKTHSVLLSNVRGIGLMLAFDLPTNSERNRFIEACLNNDLLVLPTGPRGIRFRPHVGVTPSEISEVHVRLERALKQCA